MSADPFPTVPSAALDDGGWVLDERTSETVFSLSAVRVTGHTLLYEQPALRTRLRDTVEGGDLPWRFFFATRLVLEPTPSDIVSAGLLPTVRATARREFVADLEERGFSAVDRERTRRVRIETGERVRFARLVVRFETGEVAATVHAWFGVWNHEREFRIAGGAYPVRGFSGIDLDPAAYRTELFGLLRCVA